MQNIKLLFKTYWPVLIVFLLCGFSVWPLFHVGFFPMHDDEQIARLYEMVKVLGQGQLPPRWVPDLGFGYGYPLFNFYPPFVYYLGAFFHLFQVSYIVSTKLVIGVGFLLSALFMYLWMKNRFGKLSGIFSALLYTYAPYHAVDIYVRGALSEFFSFVFIPAVFWSLDRLAKKQTRGNVMLTSVLLCFVVLTHTLVMMQFFPFLILYMLYLLYEQRKSFKKLFPSFIVVGILGFGLSAYFAVPSVLEKQYTLVDSILTRQLANYSIHFVCPSQLWSSTWGYGGSVAGCVDGLSFEVGKLHIVLSLLAVGIALLVLLLRQKNRQILFTGFIAVLFAFSLFLTTDFSKPIWDAIQPLSYIQFPWRFLLFAVLFSSVLGGYVLWVIERFFTWKAAVVGLILLSALAFYQIRHDFHPSSYMNLTDDHYIAHNDIQWRVSGLSYEYVPKQVATRLSVLNTTELAIDKGNIPTAPFTVLSGNMHVQVQKDFATEKRLIVATRTSGTVQINTYSFPGWKVFVDGKQTHYLDTNRLHLIQIPLSPGTHSVQVLFTNTPIRTIGDIVSILCLLSLLGIVFVRKKIFR